ncbi:hypothetical protein JCM24511_03269 [Saitozyma sp. JCM 24511]|nr:hypothetical protein JCM24511_03269 [Saitozyma sp. JCM 24511]
MGRVDQRNCNTIFKRRININITITIDAQTIKRCSRAAAFRPLPRPRPSQDPRDRSVRRPHRCDATRMRDEGHQASGKGKGKGSEMDGRWDTTHPDPEGWEKGYKPPERARFLFSFSFFRL